MEKYNKISLTLEKGPIGLVSREIGAAESKVVLVQVWQLEANVLVEIVDGIWN